MKWARAIVTMTHTKSGMMFFSMMSPLKMTSTFIIFPIQTTY